MRFHYPGRYFERLIGPRNNYKSGMSGLNSDLSHFRWRDRTLFRDASKWGSGWIIWSESHRHSYLWRLWDQIFIYKYHKSRSFINKRFRWCNCESSFSLKIFRSPSNFAQWIFCRSWKWWYRIFDSAGCGLNKSD